MFLKLLLLVVWPPFAVLLLVLIALTMTMVWLLIPFGTIKRKADDTGYEFVTPW